MKKLQRQRTAGEHHVLLGICGALALMFAWALFAQTSRKAAEPPRSKISDSPPEIELQGKVVCLAEEMHKTYGVELPSNHDHLYGVKSKDGIFYTLLRTKFSEALFTDKRLQEKELILKGRGFPKTQTFEVTGGLRSVREGQVYELYYYCDICAIQTIAPGNCMCCQGPVELVEKPLHRETP